MPSSLCRLVLGCTCVYYTIFTLLLCAKRGRFCRPEPRRLCHLWQAHHQKTLFQILKNLGGGNQKICKGFFWRGAAGVSRPLGGAAHSLAAALEFGSRKSVKLHQNGTFREIAALWGGFFSGGAQRQPAVFLGGMRFGAPASWCTFLFFCRHSRHAPRPRYLRLPIMPRWVWLNPFACFSP